VLVKASLLTSRGSRQGLRQLCMPYMRQAVRFDAMLLPGRQRTAYVSTLALFYVNTVPPAGITVAQVLGAPLATGFLAMHVRLLASQAVLLLFICAMLYRHACAGSSCHRRRCCCSC